ncbi:MAG: hypothetical protein JJU11_10825 [Candidatus Sumerlaeia bacterium]|nr:hypothetical protein [Candidatus Sumerlaeia bacterium]
MIFTRIAVPSLLALLSIVSPVFAVPIHTEILDPDRAREDGQYLFMKSDADVNKSLGKAPIMFHIQEPLPGNVGAGLEITAHAAQHAEIEAMGYYVGGQNFLLQRRTIEENEYRRIRWEVPSPDRLTSFTLNVRSASPIEAAFDYLEVRNLDPLLLPHRLEAFHDKPLALVRAAEPIKDGVLDLFIRTPEFLKPQLGAGQSHVRVTDARGESVSVPLDVYLTPGEDSPHYERVNVSVPIDEDWEGPLKARLVVPGRDMMDHEMAPIMINTDVPNGDYYEKQEHSIESFAVMVQYGELVFYTALASAGITRSPAGIPLPTREIHLTAGNGTEWATEETMITVRRDVDWMLAGPSAIAVEKVADYIHMIFTITGLDGLEGIGTAQGIDTLRLVPSPRNPVWIPPLREDGTPSGWRANALINFENRFVLAGLHEATPGETTFRLLFSEFPWRWTDLGPFPLKDFRSDTMNLSVRRKDDRLHALMGPTPSSYKAQHPLWGWEKAEAPTNLPEWRNLQIVEWNGTDYLFGIEERNGRGIVRWQPLTPDQSMGE